MGKLATFGTAILKVRGNDHNPPHFHVIAPDFHALVEIETLNVWAGYIPNAVLDVVRTWAMDAQNFAALCQEWNRCNPAYPLKRRS